VSGRRQVLSATGSIGLCHSRERREIVGPQSESSKKIRQSVGVPTAANREHAPSVLRFEGSFGLTQDEPKDGFDFRQVTGMRLTFRLEEAGEPLNPCGIVPELQRFFWFSGSPAQSTEVQFRCRKTASRPKKLSAVGVVRQCPDQRRKISPSCVVSRESLKRARSGF
jgi:hypothetical protein